MRAALRQGDMLDAGDDDLLPAIELIGADDELYWDDDGFLGIERVADRLLLGILAAGCGVAMLGTLAVAPVLAVIVGMYDRG